MNTFFIEFRDPLFGIIIFFVIVFIVAFVSYWYAKFKIKEDSKHLDRFLKQFHTLPSQKELNILISKGEMSEKSWLLLASSYTKNGDFEKSIEIYNEILKITDNTKETLFLLGKTYFKAGFLERAKQIFFEILKNNPRTPQALKYLLLVYEYTREYNLALEVLEPLDELKKDISTDKNYLNALLILNNNKLSIDEKTEKLLNLYHNTKQLTYMIFEYLFRVNPKLAWENFDVTDSELLIDILWRVDRKDLDLAIISNDSYLRELYTARGDVALANKSSIFELDVLINLHKASDATLGFEYVCNDCKQIFPFAFNRCSHCHSIDTIVVEYMLTKDYNRNFFEENNSFQ